MLSGTGDERRETAIKIYFFDTAHEAFYAENLARAEQEGRRADSYFKSLIYLLGLCAETRVHFDHLFDWKDWYIQPEALSAGWQTGTTGRVTRLAFNLWNGYGQEDPESNLVSARFLPDEIFSCEFQMYFFEAVRLRFPEYANTFKT